MTIRISRRAQRDLDGMRDYTLAHWGRNQWLKYYRGLAEAFERIEATPMCGQSRGLLGPGMRSLNYEKHLVFFEPVGRDVAILRIIHQRRHLPGLIYYDDLDA